MTNREALDRIMAILNEEDWITETFVIPQRQRVRYVVMEALADPVADVDWNTEAAHGNA